MFFGFLDELRAAGIPASLKEHLMLLEALDREVIDRSPEQFYYLSRAIYVKDEGQLDRFDQVFNKVFRSEEHTSELQSLMRISYAVFCLKKKNIITNNKQYNNKTPNKNNTTT